MTPHLNQLVAVNNQLCQREKLTAEADSRWFCAIHSHTAIIDKSSSNV